MKLPTKKENAAERNVIDLPKKSKENFQKQKFK